MPSGRRTWTSAPFSSSNAAIRPLSDQERRRTWLRYARWLVAALTFQLAADIIETSVTTDWQTIGRLGAIAVIRTFLNYFLERDVEEEQRKCDNAGSPPARISSRKPSGPSGRPPGDGSRMVRHLALGFPEWR